MEMPSERQTEETTAKIYSFQNAQAGKVCKECGNVFQLNLSHYCAECVQSKENVLEAVCNDIHSRTGNVQETLAKLQALLKNHQENRGREATGYVTNPFAQQQ